MADIEKLVEELSALSVLEAADLVKAFCHLSGRKNACGLSGHHGEMRA